MSVISAISGHSGVLINNRCPKTRGMIVETGRKISVFRLELGLASGGAGWVLAEDLGSTESETRASPSGRHRGRSALNARRKGRFWMLRMNPTAAWNVAECASMSNARLVAKYPPSTLIQVLPEPSYDRQSGRTGQNMLKLWTQIIDVEIGSARSIAALAESLPGTDIRSVPKRARMRPPSASHAAPAASVGR
jgi:hypothetical protein